MLIATVPQAITRDSTHKRRETGGRRHPHKKKCKFETGRQGANTKMGAPRIRTVRCMGGNQKFRALRLDAGNFSWGSEAATRKTRILDVMYNASNNELVRTKTLVKNAIIAVDATPFRAYYETHYGVKLGKAKEGETDVKKSEHVQRKLTIRNKDRVLDPKIQEQFDSGRLLACISSRPGQSGRADGYILEGRELEFYQKQILKRKGKKGEKAAAASA